MSKPHPLADEISEWVRAPDKWQWQTAQKPTGVWFNVTFDAAICGRIDGLYVRLTPKRSMIPADRLPEGWEVERNGKHIFVVKSPAGVDLWLERKENPWFFDFLRDIDPEAA